MIHTHHVLTTFIAENIDFVSPNQYAQILTNVIIAIAYITILLFFFFYKFAITRYETRSAVHLH